MATRNFVPRADSQGGIGTSSKKWLNGYFDNLTLDSGATISEFSTDGNMAGDSDTAVPTEKAVKKYVDDNVGSASVSYHGIESYGTMSWSDVNTTLTLASGTNKYWYKGTNYITSSAVTCDLADSEAKDGGIASLTANTLYWVYFKDATGKLYWSSVAPSLKEACPVATVFWTGAAGAACREAHNHTRDLDWHINAHRTIGSRYVSGLDITKPTTTDDNVLDLTTGYIYDEDILHTITNQTISRIWYPINTNTAYEFVDRNLPYGGTSGDPKYANGSGLISVDDNQYVAMWVYASPDIDRPIYIFPGSSTSTQIATIRAQTPPALGGFNLTSELRLLYRWIYKGDGEFQESADYRMTSSLPSGFIASTSAGAVSFLPSGNVAATNVQTAIEEVDAEKIAIPASSAQGDVLIRGASAWSRLAAGDSGKYLRTNGAAADPSWETVSATVDLASPGAIGETTPGTIRSYNKELVFASTDTLDANECAGTLINNYGQSNDATITLPAAADGMSFTVVLGTTVAKYYRLDPAAGDSIYLNGITTGDGKYIGIASALIGASITFLAFKTGASAYDWYASIVYGNWLAEA